MMVALRKKNKLGFIIGTLTRPHDEDQLSIGWDRCIMMVISQSVMWMNIITEFWHKLKERYHQGIIF